MFKLTEPHFVTHQQIIDIADWCKANKIKYNFYEGNNTGNVWKDLEKKMRNPGEVENYNHISMIRIGVEDTRMDEFNAEWEITFKTTKDVLTNIQLGKK